MAAEDAAARAGGFSPISCHKSAGRSPISVPIIPGLPLSSFKRLHGLG